MELPQVTILIAAYNEREILLQKIRNCYALNYPADQMDILVVTDGSTDGSNEILFDLPLVRVLHLPARSGKLAAVNRAMNHVKSPIVVLTDANCMLNQEALQNIVRHYQDPKVGAVSGEKRVIAKEDSSGQGEGIYWRYESFLKKLDSDWNTTVGAAGELFSFRRYLYKFLPEDTIIEDFVLAMEIASDGYRVVYEPKAIAEEEPSANLKEEWKRKVRICAGGFQAISLFSYLLKPRYFNLLSFQFFSHRLLRWAVVPFLFPIIFLLTFWGAYEGLAFYQFFFLLQAIAYVLAAAGLFYTTKDRLPKLISIPFQFAMMNAAAYAGLIRYWAGSQSAVWEKSKRKPHIA
jgi:cellulose synthase/poly-beta-1,6-N-acetylglucosamine synthase-like glycosyltransferase